MHAFILFYFCVHLFDKVVERSGYDSLHCYGNSKSSQMPTQEKANFSRPPSTFTIIAAESSLKQYYQLASSNQVPISPYIVSVYFFFRTEIKRKQRNKRVMKAYGHWQLLPRDVWLIGLGRIGGWF